MLFRYALFHILLSFIYFVDMPRGRGRGSTCRVGKSSVRGNFATRKNMSTVPIPTITPQQGGMSFLGVPDHINQVQTLGPTCTPPNQTSGHGSTPTINLEPSPNTPNQSNTIGEGTSSQSNIIGETECSNTRKPRTLLTISPTGLVHTCTITFGIFLLIYGMPLNNVF